MSCFTGEGYQATDEGEHRAPAPNVSRASEREGAHAREGGRRRRGSSHGVSRGGAVGKELVKFYVDERLFVIVW